MSESSNESLESSGEKRRTQEQNSLRLSEEDDENKGNFSVLAQMTRFLDSIMDKSSDVLLLIRACIKSGRKIVSSLVFRNITRFHFILFSPRILA